MSSASTTPTIPRLPPDGEDYPDTEPEVRKQVQFKTTETKTVKTESKPFTIGTSSVQSTNRVHTLSATEAIEKLKKIPTERPVSQNRGYGESSLGDQTTLASHYRWKRSLSYSPPSLNSASPTWREFDESPLQKTHRESVVDLLERQRRENLVSNRLKGLQLPSKKTTSPTPSGPLQMTLELPKQTPVRPVMLRLLSERVDRNTSVTNFSWTKDGISNGTSANAPLQADSKTSNSPQVEVISNTRTDSKTEIIANKSNVQEKKIDTERDTKSTKVEKKKDYSIDQSNKDIKPGKKEGELSNAYGGLSVIAVPTVKSHETKPAERAAVGDGRKAEEVILMKGAVGLGFCIEGGLKSPRGDKPITVKRLFKGDTAAQGVLKAGDEILQANDMDFSSISHYHAWNYLRSQPEGPIKLILKRKGP